MALFSANDGDVGNLVVEVYVPGATLSCNVDCQIGIVLRHFHRRRDVADIVCYCLAIVESGRVFSGDLAFA